MEIMQSGWGNDINPVVGNRYKDVIAKRLLNIFERDLVKKISLLIKYGKNCKCLFPNFVSVILYILNSGMNFSAGFRRIICTDDNCLPDFTPLFTHQFLRNLH